MKLYFATTDINEQNKILLDAWIHHRLYSYYYLKQKNQSNMKTVLTTFSDVLLDSWAYSADSRWAVINIDEYCDFIKQYNIKLYANLDVIGDWEWTARNQKYMESKWLHPLPTFHIWEDPKYFKDLVHNYEYIGLWWLVWERNKKKKIAFLDYCFSYILKNNLKTKVHWRGQTSYTVMNRYPFYSVDSSSWTAGSRFNQIYVFQNWKILTYSWADFKKRFWIDFWKKWEHYKRTVYWAIAFKKLWEYITNLHQVKWMEYWL